MYKLTKEILSNEEKDKYYNQYYPLFRNDNIKWHIITNQAIFKKINPLQLDYPICALIKYKPQPSLKSSLTNNCILLDNIQDPGNLGNIFRTVAAVTNNKTYILLSSGSVDAYHPKVLRASMGTQFALPILQNIDLATFITSYTNNKGQVFACHSGSNQQQLYHYNFSQYSRIALVFGNEGQGISTHILAAVNNYIYIPMAQCVESINVASAVAVILYELYRQSFI